MDVTSPYPLLKGDYKCAQLRCQQLVKIVGECPIFLIVILKMDMYGQKYPVRKIYQPFTNERREKNRLYTEIPVNIFIHNFRVKKYGSGKRIYTAL